MALTSDYRNIDTTGWTEDQVKHLSEFCFPMLTIEVGEISDKTIDEVYFRFKLRERLGISSFVEKINPREFFGLLKSYKGLKTNVGHVKRHVWLRKMVKNIEQDVQSEGWGDGDVIKS